MQVSVRWKRWRNIRVVFIIRKILKNAKGMRSNNVNIVSLVIKALTPNVRNDGGNTNAMIRAIKIQKVKTSKNEAKMTSY